MAAKFHQQKYAIAFLVSLVFFGINFCWLSKSSDFEETITLII